MRTPRAGSSGKSWNGCWFVSFVRRDMIAASWMNLPKSSPTTKLVFLSSSVPANYARRCVICATPFTFCATASRARDFLTTTCAPRPLSRQRVGATSLSPDPTAIDPFSNDKSVKRNRTAPSPLTKNLRRDPRRKFAFLVCEYERGFLSVNYL